MPPPPWRYRCALDDGGEDGIRKWYENESKECRRKFLSHAQALRGLPFAEWRVPLFRWLRGDEARGIGEVRFKANGLQQRVLGFRGPAPDLFTFVYPATEKSDRFIPRNAIEIAQGLRAAIEADDARSHECWLFPDP